MWFQYCSWICTEPTWWHPLSSKLLLFGVDVEHIPGGCTGLCPPVDIAVNKPFKHDEFACSGKIGWLTLAYREPRRVLRQRRTLSNGPCKLRMRCLAKSSSIHSNMGSTLGFQQIRSKHSLKIRSHKKKENNVHCMAVVVSYSKKSCKQIVQTSTSCYHLTALIDSSR